MDFCVHCPANSHYLFSLSDIMSKNCYNPYKYTTIVLAIIVAILFFFSPDCTIPYYILSGSVIIYVGWKISVFTYEGSRKLTLVAYIFAYLIVVALTLGPIFYLVIPHYADEYLFANVTSVEQDGPKYQHTFIWNSPVDGTTLSRGQDYLYNNTEESIYLVSVSYVPVKSHYPILDGGIQLKEVIGTKEIIKNNYNVFSYLEMPPDTITEKMRRFELASSKTYFFIVTEDQYFKLIDTP